MHLKRNNVEKFWPIPRKGKKFVARPSHNQKESLPLIIVVRDILKLVRNNKELKRAIHEKQVLINNNLIHDPNYPMGLFDTLTLTKLGKIYLATLSEKKKMTFEEISDKESKSKVLKVMNRRVLPSKKIQLNLINGWNILSNENINMGDSVLLNLEDKKIIKIIPLEKGRKVFVTKGKHAGKQGKVEDIIERGGKKLVKIISDGEKVNVWTKNIIVRE